MSDGRFVESLKQWKGEAIADRIMRPVAGLEAEFSLLVDGKLTKPEQLFRDPRDFINLPLVHRTGRSFQLPNGAAVYFDTGVIELATPVMELERGCCGRLARSLHDALSFVRRHLDAWERRASCEIRLQGFSAHYNVSVSGSDTAAPSRHVRDLAWLLVHLLPVPVLLIASNRRSTGVGVRPRPRRIEITVDYSPDPVRMSATGALIAAVVLATHRWRDLSLNGLRRRGIPLLDGFAPMKHTSRHGWLARFDCYARNPFTCELDADVWTADDRPISLRTVAKRVFNVFDREIRGIADWPSYRRACDIIEGQTGSWLDLDERPAAYDDAGREMPSLEELNRLGLSRYEQVVLKTLEHKTLTLGRDRFTPVKMRGWSRVVFRRERDGAQTVLPLDTLVRHLNTWVA